MIHLGFLFLEQADEPVGGSEELRQPQSCEEAEDALEPLSLLEVHRPLDRQTKDHCLEHQANYEADHATSFKTFLALKST